MDVAMYYFTSAVVPVVAGAVSLYYATVGYRRTKLKAFAIWVVAGSLALFGSLFNAAAHLPNSPVSLNEYADAVNFIWHVIYILSPLLGTWGTVLLVRHTISSSNAHNAA
jgi:hypothetical protein